MAACLFAVLAVGEYMKYIRKIIIILNLLLFPPGFSQDCTGVKIGDLPTHFHKVSGEFYVEDEYTFCIRNFSYDGRGPGKLKHYFQQKKADKIRVVTL